MQFSYKTHEEMHKKPYGNPTLNDPLVTERLSVLNEKYPVRLVEVTFDMDTIPPSA